MTINTAWCIAQEPLIKEIFRGMTAANVREDCPHVILCSINAKTFELNERILHRLPGECHTYACVDSAVCDNDEEATNYPHELLHSLTASGMPPQILNLNFGAVVMLLWNLNIKKVFVMDTFVHQETLQQCD